MFNLQQLYSGGEKEVTQLDGPTTNLGGLTGELPVNADWRPTHDSALRSL